MTLEEAEHECFILTVGSQDTSAAFISAFVDHVLQHEDVYLKLIAEILTYERRGLLSEPVVAYDETTQMPYFMACVQETLRLVPSVSMILPRYAPKNGIFIEGEWLPPNVELAANPYIIHRNTEIFGADAVSFRPERWIECSKLELQRMKRFFLAFGYGSRRCLGKNIALFESQKFLLQVGSPTSAYLRGCKESNQNWLIRYAAVSGFSDAIYEP